MQRASHSETPYGDNTTRKTQALLADLKRRFALIRADIADEEDQPRSTISLRQRTRRSPKGPRPA
ncbi:hypothetical protein ACVWZK_000995 [Bradyrhizobium sp. GM0.4]